MNERTTDQGWALAPWIKGLGLCIVLLAALGSTYIGLVAYRLFRAPDAHAELMTAWVRWIGLEGVTVQVAGSPLAVGGPIASILIFGALFLLILMLGQLLKSGLMLLSWARGPGASSNAGPPVTPKPSA